MEVLRYDGDWRKKQLFNRYKAEVISISMRDRQSASAKLQGSITSFLCQVEPQSRLNPAIQQVFDENIQSDPMWNLTMAGKTLKHLEKYALNLLTFPWKQEFWTIRSYSGFLKTQVEPFLNSYETLFLLIGYSFNEDTGSFEMIDPPLTTAAWLNVALVAFEFFVASVECKILDDIFSSIKHLNNFTVADVYFSRSKSSGVAEYFVEHLLGNLGPDNNKIGASSHNNLWCCAMCSTKNPVQNKVCQSCLQHNFYYKVPARTLEIQPIQGRKGFVRSTRPVDATVSRNPQTAWTQTIGECNSQKASPVEKVIFDHKDTNRAAHMRSIPLCLGTVKKSHQKTWRCEQCGYDNTTAISEYCSRCDSFWDTTDSGSFFEDKERSKLSQQPSVQNIAKPYSPVSLSSGVDASQKKNYEGAVPRNVGARLDLPSPGITQRVGIVHQSDTGEESQWKCVKCDIANQLESTKCRACRWNRLNDTLEHLIGHASNSDQHHDQIDHSKVRQSKKTLADLSLRDAIKPEQPTFWQCAWCTFANDPRIDDCKICQNSRQTRPADVN